MPETNDSPCYRVKNWEKVFENSRSREIKNCSYVCVPNKQHGMGFLHIITQPDGPAILGIWYLLIEACSMQAAPRKGFLTDTGSAEGRQWTGRTLSLRYRRPPEEFERALQVLCSEEVGWMEAINVGRTSAERRHLTATEGKGREGKGIEQKGSVGDSGTPEGAAPDKEKAEDDCSFLNDLRKIYTWVNLDSEIAKMRGWLLTPKGKGCRMTRSFMVRWLNKIDKPVDFKRPTGLPGPSMTTLRDDAVRHSVDKLAAIAKTEGRNSESFSRVMSTLGTEYGKLGTNRDGQNVVAEALDIITFREKKGVL